MGKRARVPAAGKIFSLHSPKTEPVIAPSILSADFANLGRDLARCRRAKHRWIHVDVMDGHFVPNLTFGPALVKSCRAAEPTLFYDTHLMVEKPMDIAEAFFNAGSHLITIHAEATRSAARDLAALRRMGAKTGISIKPRTPLSAIKNVLDEVDMVLVMTVEPGFGGQALIPQTLNKVRELDLMRKQRGLKFRLQVDGGINKSTAAMAVAAGADVLVAGSAVFSEGKGDVMGNLRALIEAMGQKTMGQKPKGNK